MKKLYKILCTLALSILMLFVSACTFFGDETRVISRIYTSPAEDEGGMYIVIEYEGDIEPDYFFIADPEPGKEGNGIQSITSEKSEDGFFTILTFNYTDITRQPSTIKIPNGTYIAGIVTETDPDTNVVTLTINFSDDTPPISIELQPGRDGKDGRDGDRIKRIEYETDEETGDITVRFIYERYNEETEEWEEYELEQSIVIPQGKNGRGITRMEINYQTYSDPNNIYFDVYYSDDTRETLTIPRTNAWYMGKGEPGPSQYNIGDFYFDTENYIIWHKEISGWVKAADFSDYSKAEHFVYFYRNDGGGSYDTYTIPHGDTFIAAGVSVPLPTWDGYRFLGWYTDADASNPNAGHFTDLTPVLSNLYLYARWEKI